jgi:FkbM family methyltransferase
MLKLTAISRVRNIIDNAHQLGWGRTLQFRLLGRLGVEEIRLRVPGLAEPVACRVKDSDIWEFNQSLGKGEEPLDLGFKPKTIVDAGANVGYASLRFQRRFPGAKIIALEPAAGNLAQFRKNCAPYPNIVLDPRALWSKSTRLRIVPMGASNAFQVREDPMGDVDATSIPDLMRQHDIDTIDLLKIDIEGSEVELFEDSGAVQWLPHVRAILIETHDFFRPGSALAVRQRVGDRFEFLGHVNEYELHVSRAIVKSRVD